MFLVWSNQRCGWWRADRRGYTGLIEEAGRYPRAEAEAIVAHTSCGGLLTHRRTDPVTGREYSAVDEVMVLAPESTPGGAS